MIFALLTLFSALSISVIAAYFSIIGLATIFPGSIEAVIAMGAALEIGKIVAAIWLHKNWKSAPTSLKIYLFSAILVLMGITSMGIFGFLSKSHIEHEQNSVKAKALVEQVETKIDREQEYIQRQKDLITQSEQKNQNLSNKSSENIDLEQKKIEQLTKQLEKDIELDNKMLLPIQSRIDKLNEELNAVKNKSGGLFSSKKKDLEQITADQAKEREGLSKKKNEIELRISKYRNETSTLISEIRKRIQDYQSIGFESPEDVDFKIEKLNQNIAEALNRIDELERQKFDLDDGSRQLEAEVGPVKYVAELIADFTGMEFDIGKAVRIVIIILIFVFDPLAVLLVLAAHISLSKKFPKAMADDTIILEKIAEVEAQRKAVENEEIEISERKKDLDQELKIIELKENQAKKYQEEISQNKEILRKLKIESQKELLKKEDTSQITEDLEELMQQKACAEKEIEEIKTKKQNLLNRADETIKSAKEIKTVLGNHKQNKEKIEELKSEICLNIEQFEKIKLKASLMDNENKELLSKNKKLKEDISKLRVKSESFEIEVRDLKLKLTELDFLNNKLNSENKELKNRKLPDPSERLKQKLNELLDTKNKLLEENLFIKKQKTRIIKVTSKDGTNFKLTTNSSIGGNHQLIQARNFTKEEITNYSNIFFEIDIEHKGKEDDHLEKLFEQKINKLINPTMSNKQFKQLKPQYNFILDS
jgi:chromosome segregation ATPase